MILSQFEEAVWHRRGSDCDIAEAWHHGGEIVSAVEAVLEFGERASTNQPCWQCVAGLSRMPFSISLSAVATAAAITVRSRNRNRAYEFERADLSFPSPSDTPPPTCFFGLPPRMRSIRSSAVRFAADSALEGDGFEPSGPRRRPSAFWRLDLLHPRIFRCRYSAMRMPRSSKVPVAREDRWFESSFLQRGVGCELDLGRDAEGERYLSLGERIRFDLHRLWMQRLSDRA